MGRGILSAASCLPTRMPYVRLDRPAIVHPGRYYNRNNRGFLTHNRI